jgi:hypothetical protein
MFENVSSKNLHNAFFAILGVFVLLWAGVSYVQVELETRIYSGDIEGINSLCEKKDQELKYFKIVKYEKEKKTLLMQCIYKNGKENTEISAGFSSKWSVFKTTKLNQKSGFYWPIFI